MPSTVPADLFAPNEIRSEARSEARLAYWVERRHDAGVSLLGVRTTPDDAFALAATCSLDAGEAGEVRVVEIAPPTGAAHGQPPQTVRVWTHVGKGVWTACDDRGSASRL